MVLELLGYGLVVVVNIGGVFNIMFVLEDGLFLVFDIGFGNGLIDDWVLDYIGVCYDEDGVFVVLG